MNFCDTLPLEPARPTGSPLTPTPLRRRGQSRWISLVIALLLPSFTLAQMELSREGMTVTGTGTVYGAPDMALLELGVNVSHEDVGAAVEAANSAMRQLTEALRNADVAERDIRTSYLNVWLEERYSPAGDVLMPSYRVMNALQVNVRDTTRVGEILALAVEAGANTVMNVSYLIADSEALEARARELAMQRARRKAEQLAALAGVTLGELVSLSEMPGYVGPYYPHAGMMAESGGDMAVSEGQLAVSVSLSVGYRLRDDPDAQD